MGRLIQIVTGPAGTGKSTYCKTIQEYCATTKRSLYVGNIDPAAEFFEYEASFDIKSIISVDEVMEQLSFGPNGGLVYCMEFLLENSDWLKDELDKFGDDDYVVLDCPGQIELYSHLPIMHNLVKLLEMWGYRVISVYLVDALFVLEPAKFISGCLLSLSCMMQLEVPHINIVTKVDLADKEELEGILNSDSAWLINSLQQQQSGMIGGKLKNLSRALASVVDDYMMVSFLLLDITDDESIENIILHTDMCGQYGEDLEPREPKDTELEDEDGEFKDHNPYDDMTEP